MSTSITIPSQSVTIPSQVVSIPVVGIVYQNSWLAQTASISTTTLFTPPSDGLYRLIAGGKMTSGSNLLNFTVDSISAGQQLYAFQNQGSFMVAPFGGAGVTWTYAISNDIFCQASVPITMSVGLTGSSTYDVYVTIEQL